MTNRFNIRDKCKVWNNNRTQQGVLDWHGLTFFNPHTQFRYGLDADHDGRYPDSDHRRNNEPVNNDWFVDQARQEVSAANQYNRDPERPELFGNGLYLTNEPLREDIFDDVDEAQHYEV